MEQEKQRGDFKRSFNQFVGWCQCIAYLGEAWLRLPGTAGSRYFTTGPAFIGWAVLLVLASFGNSEPLFIFWAATDSWFLVHGLASYERKRKGHAMPHSRYVGRSLLSFLGGNKLAIQLWEPGLAFVAGLQLIKEGYGFGGLIVILAMCMFVSASHAIAAATAKIRAINDARVEQEWLAEATRR